MKIMAFVDSHGDENILKKLITRAKKKDIDLVICAGDFTVFENQMKGVLTQLNSIGRPVLIVPGNHENADSLTRQVKKFSHIINMHMQLLRKDGVTFMGWGTDGFTRRSEEMRDVAREWRRKLTKEDTKRVIITHAPPYRTKLDKIGKDYVGNADIRKAIERIQPVLAIAGHIHENAGEQDKIGRTVCVNPGWKGMIMTI